MARTSRTWATVWQMLENAPDLQAEIRARYGYSPDWEPEDEPRVRGGLESLAEIEQIMKQRPREGK